ncbi:MAG: hypothetical protein ACR2MD_01525 [Aridibacter sp.]
MSDSEKYLIIDEYLDYHVFFAFRLIGQAQDCPYDFCYVALIIVALKLLGDNFVKKVAA